MHVLQELFEEVRTKGVGPLQSHLPEGRLMARGQECLSVDLVGMSIGDFIADMFEAMESQLGAENREEISRAFRSMGTADSGHGIVVYFPNIQFERS